MEAGRVPIASRMFRADIEDPAAQADEMGMSHEEFIQLYVDAVAKADASHKGLEIVENTPEVFTVEGPEDAVIEYGFQVNQAEGGPSFNEEEYRDYAMYEV